MDAYRLLRTSGPEGARLAAVLDTRRTRVWVTPRVSGGFTLNFLNTIFLQPPTGATGADLRAWTTLLGHEAEHVDQRAWVDSIQQELRSYQAQARVARELGLDGGAIERAFEGLDPNSPDAQKLAQAAMLTLFAGSPAAIVYAALPLLQPRGLTTVSAALRQLAAVIRAGLKRK